MANVLFEVEYEIPRFRHIYVTCPKCGSKFSGYDAFEKQISCAHQLSGEFMTCPICGAIYNFGNYPSDDKAIIKEVDYPECAKGAKQKKVVWE